MPFKGFRSFDNSKKSQVTIFIVIGLIILVITGVLFFINQKTIETEFSITEKVIEVPQELKPINSFITRIISDVGIETLQIIGLQGGWVSLTNTELAGETFLKHPDPTSSEIVEIYELKTPYWYFMDSDNSCYTECRFSRKGRPILESYYPKEDRSPGDSSVEAQIDRYLEEKLPGEILKDILLLEKQGYDLTLGTEEIYVETVIGENDVSIYVKQEIKIESENVKGELKEFIVRIPINIRKMFKLADKIVEAQTQNFLLDNSILNWITIFQGLEGELPPPHDIEIGMGGRVWIKSEVERFIQYSLLTPFIQAIQIKGTKNYEVPTLEGDNTTSTYFVQKGILSSFSKNFLETNDYEDISVNFFYNPMWNIYLNIDPSEGEMIKPEPFGNDLVKTIMPINIQKYKFFYDVSAPIIVMLRDDTALNGEGYNFQFAIESNIRTNKPLTPGTETITIAGEQEKTLFNDPRTWISGNITIETVDYEGKPVEGVDVRYSCGPLSAYIGKTEITPEGKTILSSKFPICTGGSISLKKHDYLGYKWILLDTAIGEEGYILIQI